MAAAVGWDSDRAAFSVSAGEAAVVGLVWWVVIVKEKGEEDSDVVQMVKNKCNLIWVAALISGYCIGGSGSRTRRQL